MHSEKTEDIIGVLAVLMVAGLEQCEEDVPRFLSVYDGLEWLAVNHFQLPLSTMAEEMCEPMMRENPSWDLPSILEAVEASKEAWLKY